MMKIILIKIIRNSHFSMTFIFTIYCFVQHFLTTSATSLKELVKASTSATNTGGFTGKFYKGDSADVSNLIEYLMFGYDKRLRPNYKGDPVDVGITMHVSSVSSISEVNMDYTIDIYFRQYWRDERLIFEKDVKDVEELCISNEMLDSIWWPDTFFANAKSANFHTATTKNAFLRINSTGWVTQSLRLTVTAMCNMELTLFPLDTQVCSLEIESYAYSVKHITYRWKNGPLKSISFAEGLQQPQFKLSGFKLYEKTDTQSTGQYSRLACHFTFTRSLGYYIIHIYIPSSLLVILSWVSFWLHRNAVPARVALGITTVLTMTTLISSSNNQLPKISYLKSIDVYLVTCFVMAFAALLEYAVVSYIGDLKWKPKPPREYAEIPKTARARTCSAGNTMWAQRRRDFPRRQSTGTDHVTLSNERLDSELHPVNCRRNTTPTLQALDSDSGYYNSMPRNRFSQHNRHSPDVDSTHTHNRCTHYPSGSILSGGSAKYHPVSSSPRNPRPSAPEVRPKMNGPATVSVPAPAPSSGSNPYIRKSNAIDRYSRAIFPLVFLLFNITYWAAYTKISRSQVNLDFTMLE